MFEGMGANGPLGSNPPPVNQSHGDIHKATFNFAQAVKQKIIEQPKPRFIRDNMKIDDINCGTNGEFSPGR